jgi:hypothetical protein
MSQLHLRLDEARNGQHAEIRYAANYTERTVRATQGHLTDVEPAGIEPATSCLQSRRSPN